jgi:outer membrane protein, heavy metal efflux system
MRGHRVGMMAWVCCLAAGAVANLEAQSLEPPGSRVVAVESESAPQAATVGLPDLVRRALDNNPAIQAAQREAEARKALITPARTLPDPTFTFQNMGNIIPPDLQAGDPSSARTFGIEQEIPFPGKLSLQGKIASQEAESAQWTTEQTRRQVIADLKEAYYDLCFVHKSIETLEKDKGLLETFTQIAEAKYRVGQGIQQDVLKAQVEVSRLLDRLAVLEQKQGVARARINSLLGSPPDAPLGNPEEIRKAVLRRSYDELVQLARDNDPTLKGLDREIDRNQYAVALARKDFYPDFSAGFTYYNRQDVPEMYGLLFGAKLPVYFWRKQQPELQGAASRLAGSQKQRDNAMNELSFKLKDAYLTATTSERLLQLYSTGVIPQSTLSLESAVAGYQVGKVDFLTLLDNLVTLLDDELRYYEVLTDFQKALARIEPLVGMELTQ